MKKAIFKHVLKGNAAVLPVIPRKFGLTPARTACVNSGIPVDNRNVFSKGCGVKRNEADCRLRKEQ